MKAAVLTFIAEAHDAQEALRALLVGNGLDPAHPTLAHADHGIVEQRGQLPDGGRYFFHGIGAVIKPAGRAAVDIDWERDGTMIIDTWKFGEWLNRQGARKVATEEAREAMDSLVADGALDHTDWPEHFTVVRRPGATSPSPG